MELAASGPMMDTYLIPILQISGGPEPLKMTNFVGLCMRDTGLGLPGPARGLLSQPQAHLN